MPVSKGIEMGRNEFDAHRSLAGSRNAWAPVPPPARRLTADRVLAWLVAAVAVLGALSALGAV